MDDGRNALERAVAALFADATSAPQCASCGDLATLPPDWSPLLEFPVLARYVVVQWQEHTRVLPRGTSATSRAARISDEQRVRSMARLCAYLTKCRLFEHGRGGVSELLVVIVRAIDSWSVLSRIVQQRTLALATRCLLLSQALQQHCLRDSAAEVTSKQVRDAVTAACLILHQELREVAIEAIAETPAPSRKRSRRAMTSIHADMKERFCCDECVQREVAATSTNGQVVTFAPSRCALGSALREFVLHHANHGATPATHLQAVSDLIDALHAPDTIGMLGRCKHNNGSSHQSLLKRDDTAKAILRWAYCDQLVQATVKGATAQEGQATGAISTWLLVWSRECARLRGSGPDVALADVVYACWKADTFARRVVQEKNESTHSDVPSVGFRVASSAIQSVSIHFGDAVRLLAAAAMSPPSVVVSTTSAVGEQVTQTRVCPYLRWFFLQTDDLAAGPLENKLWRKKRPKAEHTIKDEPATSEPAELVELMTRVHAAAASRQGDVDELWSLLLQRYPTRVPANLGLSRSLRHVDAVARICEAVRHDRANAHLDGFSTDLDQYVANFALRLMISNGGGLMSMALSTPGSVDRQDWSETERRDVQDCVSRMVVARGAQCLASLIFSVCRQGTRSAFAAQSIEVRGALWCGVRWLLLPTLSAAVAEMPHPSRDQFLAGVFTRTAEMITQRSTQTSLVEMLLRLVYEWDMARRRASSQDISMQSCMGLRALPRVQLFPAIVHAFSAPNRRKLQSESPDFLTYLGLLLRSNQEYPREFDGLVFVILSTISTLTTGAPKNEHALHSLISHSDGLIQRVLDVFQERHDAHCRAVLAVLDANGKLDDLTMCLTRWLSILEQQAVVPKETLRELHVVCNRLLYWLDGDVGNMRGMVTPLDAELEAALQSFVHGNGFNVHTGGASSTLSDTAGPRTSFVRLSLTVRAYVGSPGLPDLRSLTSTILANVLESTSSTTRDDLLKLIRSFSSCIIAEVVVDTLRNAMLPFGDVEGYVTPSKAVRLRVTNALAAFAAAPIVFSPRDIYVTSDIFSMRASEQWLTCFLATQWLGDRANARHYVKLVEKLLDCVSMLLETERSSSTLRHGYTVAAVLSTTAVALQSALHSDASALMQQCTAVSMQLHARLDAVVTVKSDKPTDPEVKERNECQLLGVVGDGSDTCKSAMVAVASDSCTVSAWHPVIRCALMVDDEMASVPRYFLPFASWLTAALTLPLVGGMATNSLSGAWEDAFMNVVLNFYLPIQFYGRADELLTTWVRTCVRVSIRADSSKCDAPRFVMLPFQVSLFKSLFASRVRIGASRSQWLDIIAYTRLVLDELLSTMGESASVARLPSLFECLDLIGLCVTQDTASKSDVGALADAIVDLSAHDSIQNLELVERLRVLAPSLELLVHAALLGASVNAIRDALTRAFALFAPSLSPEDDAATNGELLGKFLTRWRIKYSYLNPPHATAVFSAIDHALRNKKTPPRS